MEVEKLASIFESVALAPLKPNDVVVVKLSAHITMEQHIQVHDKLEEQLGKGTKILILDPHTEIAIVRREEAVQIQPGPSEHFGNDPVSRHHRSKL